MPCFSCKNFHLNVGGFQRWKNYRNSSYLQLCTSPHVVIVIKWGGMKYKAHVARLEEVKAPRHEHVWRRRLKLHAFSARAVIGGKWSTYAPVPYVQRKPQWGWIRGWVATRQKRKIPAPTGNWTFTMQRVGDRRKITFITRKHQVKRSFQRLRGKRPILLKWIFEESDWGCGLNWGDSGKNPVACFSEYGNGISGSIKAEFLY
jgi:hypothetical protein